MAILANGLDAICVNPLFAFGEPESEVVWRGKGNRGWHSRRSTDAQYIQLGLIQAHIAKSETSEDAAENDENGNQTSKYYEFGIVGFFIGSLR